MSFVVRPHGFVGVPPAMRVCVHCGEALMHTNHKLEKGDSRL